ncbi:MAG: octaprenyl-diphosphate synthase [Halieaceae bacterium]|jgi:octaprenyl-diphosphate synthase
MDHIRQIVASEFDAVNDLIVEQLESDVPLVENIGHYIVEAGGKRLRPLLVLLSAACCHYRGREHIRLATVIEFIHTATLLHDDVVDISSLRRGRPTVNATWGNAPSVLVGDFIYSRAFQLMVAIGDMDIMANLSSTTNTIAAGEVLQLSKIGDATTTETQYLEIIERKTAILFASACRGAAQLAGMGNSEIQHFHDYGLNLGMAFQLIDDVLDYEGDPATMGKNVGDDLAEGKLTLPLIHCLEHGRPEEQELITNAITTRSVTGLKDVVAAVAANGSLAYAREQVNAYSDKARAALQALPDNKYRDALAELISLASDRNH